MTSLSSSYRTQPQILFIFCDCYQLSSKKQGREAEEVKIKEVMLASTNHGRQLDEVTTYLRLYSANRSTD
jgi:hypothetical protein